MNLAQKLCEVIKESLHEMDRCPEDSIQDIWNEKLEGWKTGLRMDHHFNIDNVSVHRTAYSRFGATDGSLFYLFRNHFIVFPIPKPSDPPTKLATRANARIIRMNTISSGICMAKNTDIVQSIITTHKPTIAPRNLFISYAMSFRLSSFIICFPW